MIKNSIIRLYIIKSIPNDLPLDIIQIFENLLE